MIEVSVQGLFAPLLESGPDISKWEEHTEGLRNAHRELMARRGKDLGFYDLPANETIVKSIESEVQRMRSIGDDLLVLGIGGSGPTKRIPSKIFLDVINKISKIKKCKFFLATGKNEEEQIILREIQSSKFENLCYPLDNFSIKEVLPIIKCCDLSICNDSSFSHLSAALGIKTITLMADTPLIYGSYNSNMFPILPDGEQTVSHNTLGKEKINPEKIFNKLIEISN